ncbi:Acetyltransferase (GNAT) domain-containing protein [Salegentibacter holothuriorum]|uniref:Acetyltransferase (GNAT) domain-containing protein n=1 Tax=Salegentibacter holothuriorum TaxID=241145 RepID=A0A1T5AQ06_9FLAO|nr:GNAT family N-acetyltransferase [Salegentibacter holothuriorum]SKB36949.1 Acetyltransferase (GNAT) domain-containing protein [Salegentibacter holothuriorum]
MKSYKALKQQQFTSGEYSIVPIRSEDRYDIMEWRNEQMYHLRQKEALTKENQDFYFDSVVESLFEQNKPSQILFSYLEGEKCIGYGGLVHINWTDKNAEISFIMNTDLEKENFEFHWTNFLNLLEYVAWKELNLHKVYTYAYDLRPHIYMILEKLEFKLEARLKNHLLLEEGNYCDILIHAKFNYDENL